MGISCYCAVSNFPLSLFFLFTESIFSFTARVFLLPRKFLFRCELFTFAVALVGQCNNTFNNKFEARDQHEERNTVLMYFRVWNEISFIMFSDFLMFYQIFLSPQVKRWAIITYKHGIYELCHELLNDWRLRILGNQEMSGKCPNPIEW